MAFRNREFMVLIWYNFLKDRGEVFAFKFDPIKILAFKNIIQSNYIFYYHK